MGDRAMPLSAFRRGGNEEDRSQAPTPARGATPEYEGRPHTSHGHRARRDKPPALVIPEYVPPAEPSSEGDSPSHHALRQIERRLRARKFPYDAMESHCNYGLTFAYKAFSNVCVLLLHVPRHVKNYCISVRPGDQLQTITRDMTHMILDVLFVTPHRYYAPGRRVTTALLGVSEDQWAPLLRDANTSPPPLRDANTSRPPLHDANTLRPPLRDANTSPPPLHNGQLSGQSI